MTKSETNSNCEGRRLETVSVIPISSLEFVSDFGFRISDFPDPSALLAL
jgi:hypothetical protein